jgi:hypothetical protein
MSEPWMLEDWDDTLDTNDIFEDKVFVKTQFRHHYVFSRSKLVTASEVSAWASSIGRESATVSARLGDVEFSRTMVSTGKYICVRDKCGPYQHPAAFGRQEQTWEYYSAWEDAPEGWGGDAPEGEPEPEPEP